MPTPGIPPNISVPGIVGSIPTGYLLGRVSPGTGPIQLVRFSDFGSGASGTGKSSGSVTPTPTSTTAGGFAQFDTALGAGSSSAFCYKGVTLVPSHDMFITGVGACLKNATNGATYQATIVALDGSSTTPTITSVVASSTTTTFGLATGANNVWVSFAAPVKLTALTNYAVLFGQTSGTSTFALPVASATALTTLPVGPFSARFVARIASLAPAAGQGIDTNAGGVPAIALAFIWTL